MYSEVVWGNAGQDYYYSNIYQECLSFDQNHNTSSIQNIANAFGSYAFIPTYEQVSGEFTWFDSNSRRIANYNGYPHIWSTQTKYDSTTVYYVGSSGAINYGGISGYTGFRPCICIRTS